MQVRTLIRDRKNRQGPFAAAILNLAAILPRALAIGPGDEVDP